MDRLLRFWRSSIGKKVVMAATGIIGIGFLVAHVASNLLVFRGAAAFNGYSAFLHGPLAELLWLMRLVLLAALLLARARRLSDLRQTNASEGKVSLGEWRQDFKFSF